MSLHESMQKRVCVSVDPVLQRKLPKNLSLTTIIVRTVKDIESCTFLGTANRAPQFLIRNSDLFEKKFQDLDCKLQFKLGK